MSVASRGRLGRAALMGSLLILVATVLPRATLAAVGDALVWPPIPPTAVSPFVDPTCGPQGGSSLAIVQGSKLKDVDPVAVPVALVVSCLDNNDVQTRARLNFLDPANGKVVKQLLTRIGGVVATPTATPRGWPHFANQVDRARLIACGSDGSLYGIDYSQFPSTTDDGVAAPLTRPSGLPPGCAALGYDPEGDLIYQGVPGNDATVGIYRFAENGTTTKPFDNQAFVNTPGCTPAGIAITGGVLVVACKNQSTILRVDKNTGLPLGTFGQLGVLEQLAGQNLSPSLGDLACDPVTFSAQYKDAMWSRNGNNGNGVVPLKFPPFTCGLPGNATVLWAGLSAPGGGLAGAAPSAQCFNNLIFPVLNGNGFDGDIIDSDADGSPDCWEDGSVWPFDNKPGIDFNGDGIRDLKLCVAVDTNGDGIAETEECANKLRKDLFVEIDWMAGRKPDPGALSQAQPVPSIGIQSVREAFAWAPVDPLGGGAFKGIGIHFQVDEEVLFSTLDPNDATKKSQVTELVFTPCTPPVFTINADGTTTQNPKSLSDAADFDTIKRDNFGTAAERNDANASNILNARRLAFRYVLFANKQVGVNGGGASNSGCAEVGGDDAAVTLAAFSTLTKDDVAGTLMHEIGHTLGLRHGSHDNVNCKPNLRSLMSYTRQLSYPLGPIPNRRLDYSRFADPDLNEANLNEGLGIGFDPSLGLISQFDPVTQLAVTLFATDDKIAFAGLFGAWTVVPAKGVSAPDCPIGDHCINWDQSKFTSGKNKGSPSYNSPATANLNVGSGGCTGAGTILEGNNDWEIIQYRFTATLESADGVGHGDPETDITAAQAVEQGLAADHDGNGIADSMDCGSRPDGSPFLCTHRVDVKPSFAAQCTEAGCFKVISQSLDSTITVVIFSESDAGAQWIAPDLVNTKKSTPDDELPQLNGVDSKVNKFGKGTCSASDDDKDGIKDLKCQFLTGSLQLGRQVAVVTWVFTDQEDPATPLRRGMATQLIEVVP